jgi:hypothetical protein
MTTMMMDGDNDGAENDWDDDEEDDDDDGGGVSVSRASLQVISQAVEVPTPVMEEAVFPPEPRAPPPSPRQVRQW